VLDGVHELLGNQMVSDPTDAAAVQRFGEQGVIDPVCLCADSTLLAMVRCIHSCCGG
jgi:hypothetical protein